MLLSLLFHSSSSPLSAAVSVLLMADSLVESLKIVGVVVLGLVAESFSVYWEYLGP